MISLSHLNKLTLLVIFFTVLTFSFAFGEDEPADIWKKQENQNEQNIQTNDEKDITIEGSTLSDDVNKIIIKIDENEVGNYDRPRMPFYWVENDVPNHIQWKPAWGHH